MTRNFTSACAEWESAMGPNSISQKPSEIAAAATATFDTQAKPQAILYPTDSAAVQLALQLASSAGLTVYPISRGKNWGYGSRVPVQNVDWLLSMENMDSISDYDPQLGTIRIAPGVTFLQLNQFLREQGGIHFLAAPGSTVYASIIGNTMEKGFVMGLDPHKTACIESLEVILSNGDQIVTGMDAFCAKGSPLGQTLGPELTGLFLQSNLGIVTGMTLRLSTYPAHYQQFYFTLNHDQDLPQVLQALTDLKKGGVVSTTASVFNAYRILSSLFSFPFDHAPDRNLLPENIKQRMIAQIGGGEWFGEAGISAPSVAILEAYQSHIESVLKPLGAELFFGERNADSPLFPKTFDDHLQAPYWRMGPAPSNPNPDLDGCGLRWISPILPNNPAMVKKCINTLSETIAKAGFEPSISLQITQTHTVHLIASLIYDRRNPQTEGRAQVLYEQLHTLLAESGWIPYRLGIHDMKWMEKASPAYQAILSKLKNALDPQQMLAPGRYQPEPI